jgi:hypothetical protein
VEVVAVVLVDILMMEILYLSILLRQQIVADQVVVVVVILGLLLSRRVPEALEHLGKEIMEELEVLQLRLLVVAVVVAVLGPSEQMLSDRLEELVERVLLQVSPDLP